MPNQLAESLEATTKGGCRASDQQVSMDSSETSAEEIRPLRVSIETIANLIYLARRAETHSAQQHRYLDWAADVIKELKYHPKLNE
jgi:hypothetical protein